MIGRRLMSGIMLVAILFSGCKTTQEKQDEQVKPAGQSVAGVIEAIDIEDYAIKITLSGKFEFALSRGSDPFKVAIDLRGVDQGKFVRTISSVKEGISEIALVTKNLPEKVTTLDITMTSPYEINPVVSGNILTLKMQKQAEDKTDDIAKVLAKDGAPAVKETVESTDETAVAKATAITGVSFKREVGSVSVLIQGNGAMSPAVTNPEGALVMDIPGVDLLAALPQEIASPLKSFRWDKRGDSVRIVATIEPDTEFKIRAVADTIVISLATPAMREEAAKLLARRVDMTSPAEGVVKMKVLPDEGKCTVITQLGDNCKRISLDFQKANIVHIFRLLTEVSGLSVVVDPDVSGNITMTVKDAPWDQVLDLILRTHGLTHEENGNILRIIPLMKLEKEQKTYASIATSRQEKLTAEEMAEVRQTKTFTIKYIDVNTIRDKLVGSRDVATGGYKDTGSVSGSVSGKTLNSVTGGQSGGQSSSSSGSASGSFSGERTSEYYRAGAPRILSPFGRADVDPIAGTITVTDVARVLKDVAILINVMDKRDAQILIETRIVEVNSGAGENIGIEWGLWKQGWTPDALMEFGASSATGGMAGTLITPSAYAAGSATEWGSAKTTTRAKTAASPGSLVLGLLSFKNTLGLDLKLQALRDSNLGRILTNPRIMTVNGKAANISQGSQVPYLVQTQDGISTAFKDVTVSIKITPNVLPDKSVNLQVDINSTGLTGFSNIGGSDAPITSTLAEKTEVVVKDGETLVLGGVYKKNETSQKTNVPVLGDIPGLGWLFKTEGKRDTFNEYMIFITPRIVQTEK
jgi:type IV pilus assembly protein PilQ